MQKSEGFFCRMQVEKIIDSKLSKNFRNFWFFVPIFCFKQKGGRETSKVPPPRSKIRTLRPILESFLMESLQKKSSQKSSIFLKKFCGMQVDRSLLSHLSCVLLVQSVRDSGRGGLVVVEGKLAECNPVYGLTNLVKRSGIALISSISCFVMILSGWISDWCSNF